MRFRPLLSVAALALALFASSATISAQTTQGDGTVKLKQADGTVVPVNGATVTFYRTDIKSKPMSVKTTKDGRYTIVGLALTGIYTITVSAPGASPQYLSKVPIGQHQTNDFTLEPGNGNSLTLEQIEQAAAATGAAGASPEAAAAAKKAAEEYAKKKAEYEKAESISTAVINAFKAGNTAFDAKNYDQAIAAYDEGIKADPTQISLTRNNALAYIYLRKSVAARLLGADKYNTAARAKDQAGKDAAREYFKTAVETAEKAVQAEREFASKESAANNATPTASNASQTGSSNPLLPFLSVRVEAYRVAMQTSTPISPDDAAKAFEEYAAAEPDPAKKASAQAGIGDALFQAGKTDEAIATYRQILATNPNNSDALFGLGLALTAKSQKSDGSTDTAVATEARDMFKQFLAKAPANDSKRPQAQEAIAALDEALKPKPTETTTDTGKRRRKG